MADKVKKELYKNDHNSNDSASGDATKDSDSEKKKKDEDEKDPVYGDDDVDDINRRVGELKPENAGCWLPNHPWDRPHLSKPDLSEKMEDTVKIPETYPALKEFRKGATMVDLAKIYSNIPRFVKEMKLETSQQALEKLMAFVKLDPKEKSYQRRKELDKSPHISELREGASDEPRAGAPQESLQASSLPLEQKKPLDDKRYFLDC